MSKKLRGAQLPTEGKIRRNFGRTKEGEGIPTKQDKVEKKGFGHKDLVKQIYLAGIWQEMLA